MTAVIETEASCCQAATAARQSFHFWTLWNWNYSKVQVAWMVVATQPTTCIFPVDLGCKLQLAYKTGNCAFDSSGVAFQTSFCACMLFGQKSCLDVALKWWELRLEKRPLFTTPLHSCRIWPIVSTADLARGRAESTECVPEKEQPPHTFLLVPAAEELWCTVYLRTAFYMLKWAEYLLVVPYRVLNTFRSHRGSSHYSTDHNRPQHKGFCMVSVFYWLNGRFAPVRSTMGVLCRSDIQFKLAITQPSGNIMLEPCEQRYLWNMKTADTEHDSVWSSRRNSTHTNLGLVPLCTCICIKWPGNSLSLSWKDSNEQIVTLIQFDLTIFGQPVVVEVYSSGQRLYNSFESQQND